MLSPNEISLIKDFLVQKLSPILIMLYGSAARGNLRQDSDVDLAFLSEDKPDDYQIFVIAQELASLLGKMYS